MTEPIEYGGLHHLALVCRDMKKTVDFYTNVLEMKLKKGFDLDGGYGQHCFFDITSAVSSMNHVAFSVAPDKIEAYRDRLVERGAECTPLPVNAGGVKANGRPIAGAA